jgi:hypothetical protein
MKETEDSRKEMDKTIAANGARVYEDYYNQKNRQEQLAFSLAKISPASQFQLVTMKLSGTDVALKKRYEDAMKEYKAQYSSFSQQKGGMFGIRISSGRGSTSASMTGGAEKKVEIGEAPKFTDPEYSFATAFTGSLIDLGLLTLFNVLAFVGAFVAFLRFDMR